MSDLVGECLASDVVQRFVSGALDAGTTDQVEQHVDGCDECRVLVAALVRECTEGARVGTRAPALAKTELDLAAFDRGADEGGPAPGTRIDRYVVERRLGAGGMGVVSLADDPDLRRKVCLKLLRPELLDPDDARGTRARLLREAQAMAQVSHPHVAAVFDVGTYDDQVFIALEYIPGSDLAGWLKLERRGPDEVLEVFRAAGRGLVAAHRAGLVHRDFKPSNVMVGDDGSVKVTDFGLARAAGARAMETPLHHRPVSGAAGLLGSAITRTGAQVGTPAYMAPEQIAGGAVDARCDQFAFAVSLYEALYDARPFEGSTIEEVQAAAMDGRVKPMPRRAGVSRRVRAAVLRALQPDPAARFPTMEAMLARLSPPPTWRVAMAAAALVAVVGLAAAAALSRGDDAAVCDGGARLAAQVWNAQSRQRIVAGFAATGLKLAASTSDQIVRELDNYALEWAGAHREACMATREREEQSEHVMALRMDCLERRRSELATTVEILERPDAELVDIAYQLPGNLSAVADCADAEALAAPLPLPRDPGQRERIARVRAQVDRAEALLRALRVDQSRAAIEPAVAEATRIGWAPLEAEARMIAASVAEHELRLADAEKGFHAAAVAAERAGHDEAKLDAHLGLTSVSRARGHIDQAMRWADRARAVIERTGSRPEFLAALHNQLAETHAYTGDLPRAIVEGKRRIEMDERAAGSRSIDVAHAIYSLGEYYSQGGESDRAMAEFERALALFTELGGADHPYSIHLLSIMSIERTRQGRNQEAVALSERALAAARRVYGDDHRATAGQHYTLGAAMAALGLTEEAIAHYERSIAIYKRTNEDPSQVAPFVGDLGATLARAGRWKQAAERLEQTIAMAVAGGQGENTREMIQYRTTYGVILRYLKRYDASIDQLERAIAASEKALAPDAEQLGNALTALGDTYRAKGEPERALPVLEKAMASRREGKSGPAEVAKTRWAMAQALWNASKSRARARRLAVQARAVLAELKDTRTRQIVADIDRWLARSRRAHARRAELLER
jgi:tetratricopeptide (TPR) repeat protein